MKTNLIELLLMPGVVHWIYYLQLKLENKNKMMMKMKRTMVVGKNQPSFFQC